MKFSDNKIKYFIVALVVIVIVALVLMLIYKSSNTNETEEVVVKPEIPLHKCNIDKFTKKLSKGESTTFGVILYPSAPERNYRLKPSGFPPGVKGKLTEVVQDGKVTARIDIDVTDKAKPGSFTMAIVYEEEDENGEFIYNNCKYNLIIN
jgi:hypothetical protein